MPLQGAIVVCDGWGEGDDQLWGSGCGGITGCYGWGGDGQLWRSGRGAVAGCGSSVLWLGGSVTTNFAGVDVMPLAEWRWCHCRVPSQCALVGGQGDDQLWRSGRGAIDGCRCN